MAAEHFHRKIEKLEAKSTLCVCVVSRVEREGPLSPLNNRHTNKEVPESADAQHYHKGGGVQSVIIFRIKIATLNAHT